MEAAELFAQQVPPVEVARRLRVSLNAASRWHRAWQAEGWQALLSKGPGGRPPKLDADQLARLEAELEAEPLAHGFDDQRWTLARIRDVLGELFGVDYSLSGVWRVLDRLGWSAQIPARRAAERDEDAIATRRCEVWPRVKASRRPRAPGSVSKTKPARP